MTRLALLLPLLCAGCASVPVPPPELFSAQPVAITNITVTAAGAVTNVVTATNYAPRPEVLAAMQATGGLFGPWGTAGAILAGIGLGAWGGWATRKRHDAPK